MNFHYTDIEKNLTAENALLPRLLNFKKVLIEENNLNVESIATFAKLCSPDNLEHLDLISFFIDANLAKELVDSKMIRASFNN